MAKKRQASPEKHVNETKKQKTSKKTQQKVSEQQQPEPQKVSTQQNKKTHKAPQFNFFSQSFYTKLNNFTTLYKDFLTVKTSSSDENIDTELFEVTQKVQQSIQDQASSIFKHQLQDTEGWIDSQIKKIDEQIKGIETAYQNNRQSLLKTGAFTQDQVTKQLSPIQTKIANKKDTREKFQNLLLRSKELYE